MPRVGQILTNKQKNFVREYVKGNFNGTEAALKTYNVKARNVARQTAYEQLKKPLVQEELTSVLKRKGMDEEYITDNLHKALQAGIGEKATNSDSIRVLENMIKVYGYNPVSKHANLNIQLNSSYDSKKHSELIDELKKSRIATEKLLKDLGST